MSFSLFSFVFSYHCRRPDAVCLVVDLLQCVILSLTVGFFMGIHVGVSNGKVSIKQSQHIKFYSSRYEILDILNNFGLSHV